MKSARMARAPSAMSARHKALAAVLVLAAVLLTVCHLRLPYNTASWRMTQSSASARIGERMDAMMPDGEIDVNRATAEELEALPGVGPVLAQEIIAERETNGLFHYPEDLINVKGIGQKTLDRMLEKLCLP